MVKVLSRTEAGFPKVIELEQHEMVAITKMFPQIPNGWEISKKEELKQYFVSVPKEIQFAKLFPYYTKNKEIMLVIGKHCLNFAYKNWNFCSLSNGQLDDLVPIDCVLVPCKREELKAGDWALITYKEKHDDLEIKYLSGQLKQYVLIIEDGAKKVVSLSDEMGAKYIRIEESCPSEGKFWFKVVPRSDLK